MRTIDCILFNEVPRRRFIDWPYEAIFFRVSKYELARRKKIVEIMGSYPPMKPWPPPPPPPKRFP